MAENENPENLPALQPETESGNEGPVAGGAETGIRPTPEAGEKTSLMRVAELAANRRVAAWQLAAVLRLMGWEEDRLVAQNEFDEALAMLQSRRIGGGRI